MHIERQIEINSERRERADDRAIIRMDRQIPQAEALVGELCRDGKKIFYINITNRNGDMTGRTKDFGDRYDAIDYLIRNRYVR